MAGQSRGQVMDKIRNHKQHNYGRDEIKAGLKDITVRYGVDGFAEMFLQ